MKKLKVLFSSIILVFLLFSATFSQEKVADFSEQIVFIDKYQFEEEKTGIKRIVQAYNYLCPGGSSVTLSEILEIDKELKNPNLPTEVRIEKELLIKKLKEKDFQDYKR